MRLPSASFSNLSIVFLKLDSNRDVVFDSAALQHSLIPHANFLEPLRTSSDLKYELFKETLNRDEFLGIILAYDNL